MSCASISIAQASISDTELAIKGVITRNHYLLNHKIEALDIWFGGKTKIKWKVGVVS